MDEVIEVQETATAVEVQPVVETKPKSRIRGVKTMRVKELIESIGLDNKEGLVKAIMEEFNTSKANANAFIYNVKSKM